MQDNPARTIISPLKTSPISGEPPSKMMSNNPSSAPIQHLQYDSSQITQVSVIDACPSHFESHHYHIYCSIQVLRSQDHEIGSNEHVLDIIPAGPYPATSMNHASAFPPARCSSTIVGYDDPPQAHLAMVGVHLPIFTTLR